MEFIKVKKRYNKFTAYMLVDFTCIAIAGIVYLFLSLNIDISDKKPLIGVSLLVFLIGAFGTALITLFINSRTPKGERVKTWFHAYWMGWKVAFKIALMFTIIFIPFIFKWGIGYYEYDYTGKVNGFDTRLRKIGDNLYEDMNGHQYTSDR